MKALFKPYSSGLTTDIQLVIEKVLGILEENALRQNDYGGT